MRPNQNMHPGKPASKLALSVILGTLLVPISAVGAVVLTGHAEEVSSEAASSTTAAVDGTVAQVVYSDVQASADDLAYACGEGGLWVVDAERSGNITELQQSALDALRGICDAQGMPLPGKDPGPPIIETQTIAVQAPSSSTSTTIEENEPDESMTDDHGGYEDESEEEHEREHEPEASAGSVLYQTAHAQALTDIAYAESVGGSSEKIQEAHEKLAEAERSASRGNYHDAIEKVYESIEKAREAVGVGSGED